jgi:hypothetical protein
MLIVATRERDAARAQIESLRRELSAEPVFLRACRGQSHTMDHDDVRRVRAPLHAEQNVKPVAAPSRRSLRDSGGGGVEQDPPAFADSNSTDMTNVGCHILGYSVASISQNAGYNRQSINKTNLRKCRVKAEFLTQIQL